MKFFKIFFHPLVILTLLIVGVYYQFFLFGKIPLPADTLVGAYYPWFDYKMGYEAGIPVKNPPLSDSFSQFFLWKYLAIDFIKSGVIPLWNPYSFSGTPFLATYHSAVLLPFNLLLLLPKYWGWGIYIFAQTLVAAIGMFFLSGVYTRNNLARVGASLVFSLSGLMTTWVELGTGVYAAAALPWIFFGLESFLINKNVKYLTLFSVSFVFLYLSGHAQLTIYSTVLMFVFLIYKWFVRDLRNIKITLLVILFWFLGLGISLIQFLPTLELNKSSIRAEEAYSRTFNYGLNPFYEIVRFFAADFFGNPTTYNHWDLQSYHEQSPFLGTLVLPLVLPLLLFKKFWNKKIFFWIIIFVTFLFLAFDSPITQFLYSLPLPLLTYSSASRVFFILSFASGVLFAISFSKFIENENFRHWIRRSSVLLASLIVGALIGFLISTIIIWPYAKDVGALQILTNFKVSFKNSIPPLVILIFLFVGSFSLFKRKIFFLVLIGILFLDLSRYFLKYNPFVPSKFVFPKTPIIEYLQKKDANFRIVSAEREIMPPNTWLAYKLQSAEGYDPLSLESYGRYFNKVNMKNFEEGLSRYTEFKEYDSKFLAALNVKYILAVKRDKNGVIPGEFLNYKVRESKYKEIFNDKGSVVLENPEAKDRTFFVEEVVGVRNKKELKNEMDKKDFDPTKKAIVLSYPPKKFTNIGDSLVNAISPNELEIKVRSDKDGFLVLSQSYEKGWKAFKNGNEAKVYQVDSGLSGLDISPGENNFKLTYWPKSFDSGLKISTISLIFLVIVTIFSSKLQFTYHEKSRSRNS